ncbi:hypothetical protein KSP39_PZI007461 [Platanthera zijinensis]|uniref:Deoxynucleoside kinase domain-containing protein n=1 Tax=Platanthera zijinensis TaxID=2320716 RepID=A0AAP0GA17_9ASPA
MKIRQKKRLTFCVEGSISVGKTTILQRIANETLELRDLVEIVQEPISKWQDVGRNHFNISDAFYAEPKIYAHTFQNYVFVTRLMQERDSAAGIKPLRNGIKPLRNGIKPLWNEVFLVIEWYQAASADV